MKEQDKVAKILLFSMLQQLLYYKFVNFCYMSQIYVFCNMTTHINQIRTFRAKRQSRYPIIILVNRQCQ